MQDVPLVGYVCTQAWLKKYPRTAAAFVQAIAKAQKIASQDTAAVQQSAKYLGITQETAVIVPAPQFQLKIDPRSIQRVADLMLQFGILQVEFSTSQFIR